MAVVEISDFVPNLHHPEIMRSVLERILATGDVIGRDEHGRTVLAVAVDNWLFDALAAFGSDLEDRELDLDEDDDPAEDEEQ